MQLATMLEPALLSPNPAPARLLSSIMTRLVRQVTFCLKRSFFRAERALSDKHSHFLCRLLPSTDTSAADQPKAVVPDLTSKLHVRLQDYINRCLLRDWAGHM